MPRPKGVDEMITAASDLGKRAAAGASEVMQDIVDAASIASPVIQNSLNFYGESKIPSLRGSVKSSKTKENESPGVSALVNKPFGIGASSAMVSGNNWQSPICLRLGKRLSYTTQSIENFLKLVSGTGKVTTCCGGRLLAPADKRVHVFNAFRHNLHNSGALNSSAAYPETANILNPSNDLQLDFAGYPADYSHVHTLGYSPIQNLY